MNLPQSTIAKAKLAVQSLWDDSVNVSRRAVDGNVMDDMPVYTNIKCHLSQSSRSALAESDTTASATAVFTLYVDTAIHLQEGDLLTIRHKGQTFTGKAGLVFHRDFSNAARVEVAKIA